MADEVRVRELSVKRPPHQLDLVEAAGNDDGPYVLGLACSAESSTTFVIVKLVQLWHQRRTTNGDKSVILIEDSEAKLITCLLEGFRIQTTLAAKSFHFVHLYNGVDLDFSNADTILTSSECFLNSLTCGKVSLKDLNLVIVNSCHHVLHENSSVAKIVQKLTSHYQQLKSTKIVGITELLEHQSCPQEMEAFISKLEATFQCSACVSSDVVAMNAYGEQIVDVCSSYSSELPNDSTSEQFGQVLSAALCFLRDYKPTEEQHDCMKFITFLMSECHKALQMFGPWACAHVAGLIARECTKFAKRYAATESAMFLNFCRTQATLLHSHLKNLKGNEIHLTSLMAKLLGVFNKLKVNGEENTHHGFRSSGGRNASIPTARPTQAAQGSAESFRVGDSDPNAGLQGHPTIGTERDDSLDGKDGSERFSGQEHEVRDCCAPKTSAPARENVSAKNKKSTDPLCIVFLRTGILARALSSTMNALADLCPEYCFLRSQFVSGKKTGSGEARKLTGVEQDGMKNIQDGSVNVLVTTFEAEPEVYVSRCSLVVRIGSPPVDYVHYKQVKQKARATGAKCVVFVPEEEEDKSNSKLQEFRQMEAVLGRRCLEFCAPAVQSSSLFAGNRLAVYKPYGDGGPCVDALASIALVNRYCARFPNDGLNFPIPRLYSQEKWSDGHVEFVSYLYLPRNSPVYWPIKGIARIDKQYLDSALAREKARAQSRMTAALNACAELHKRGELDSNLDPVGRQSSFEFLAEDGTTDWEVADGGTGMVGSVKRRRAYKRKFPSVLEHGLPVAGEECHLFSLSTTLVRPGKHERSIRSQVGPDPAAVRYNLGFLCRKPLPRLPDFSIHDRAGEMRVTLAALPHSVVLLHDQLALLKRFHGYVFNHILKLAKKPGESVLSFDADEAAYGCLVVLLENKERAGEPQRNASCGKTIALDYIREMEDSLEDFRDPKDPPAVKPKDFELFRHKVVVSTYTGKKLVYYTVDVCYDRSPMDAFPSPDVAATFKEYYDARYGVDISPNQPLLDVDHVSSRLNFLVPRHQNIKGRELDLPGTDSKRAQRAKVYLVPELCSVHPIPAYLWRRIANLPTILYRMESLLLAEELRSTIAREAGVGCVEWPSDLPLPPLAAGELVGESFQPQSPADDPEIAREPGKDCVIGTSMREEAPERKVQRALLDPSAVVARAEGVAAGTEARDPSGGFSSSSSVTTGNNDVEPRSQTTRHEGLERPEMMGEGEDFHDGMPMHKGNFKERGTAGIGSAESGTLVDDRVPAGCDSGISLLPTEWSVQAGEMVQRDLLEKMSRLTVERSEHAQDETSLSCDKSGSSDVLQAPQDQPVKRADSRVSLNSGPAVATEGVGTVHRGERVPVESSLDVFARCGPPCTLILRALTCSSASDLFSLERLEMYGDAFVKYVVSSELFHKYPHDNEGKLSFLRGLRVSNRQLFYVGRERSIPAYMITRNFDPAAAWIPPAFRVEAAENQTSSLVNLTPGTSGDEEDEEDALFAESTAEVSGTATTSCSLNPYLHHVVPDKAVADVTEALVGAYLLCCGPEGALRLLSWLGFEFSFHKGAESARSQVDVTSDAVLTEAHEELTPAELTSELGAFRGDCSISHEPGSGGRSREAGPSAFPGQAAPTEETSKHGECALEGEFYGDDVSREHVELTDTQPLGEEFREAEDSTKLDHTDFQPRDQKFYGVEHSPTVVHSREQDSLHSNFREADSRRHTDRDDADSLQREFQEVEDTLQYVFSEKSLLLQAFTHVSYPREYNSVKSSYEQLEFLGDALMDFLLTRYLYFTQRDKEPGFLTDLRSALVNNYIFATLAVRCGFHRHLRAMSPPLFKIVNEFVVKQEELEREKKSSNPDQVFSAVFTLPGVLGEEPVDVEVPKVLGDVLEAVAGAVYVDSGNNPEAVWRVFFPLLKPSIDHYSVFLPISPIRQLLEMKTNTARFSSPERTIDGKFKSTLVVNGLGTFVGLGRSYRIAKSAAAQRALKRLQAHCE